MFFQVYNDVGSGPQDFAEGGLELKFYLFLFEKCLI